MKSSLVLKWLAIISLSAFVLFYLFSDRGPGKVSGTTYQAATALYGASMAKSSERIDAVSEFLDEQSSEEVSQSEMDLLNRIVDLGRSGEWKKAASTARRIMEDQIEHR